LPPPEMSFGFPPAARRPPVDAAAAPRECGTRLSSIRWDKFSWLAVGGEPDHKRRGHELDQRHCDEGGMRVSRGGAGNQPGKAAGEKDGHEDRDFTELRAPVFQTPQ